MSLHRHVLALGLGSAAAALLLLATPDHLAEDPEPRLTLTTGPLTLELGGPALVRLGTQTACFSQGCPVLDISFERSGALQRPPGEPRRVQTCETRTLERSWFIAERADEGFGEQGRVCETARPETA